MPPVSEPPLVARVYYVRGKERRGTGQDEENCTENLSDLGEFVASIYEPGAEGEFFFFILFWL